MTSQPAAGAVPPRSRGQRKQALPSRQSIVDAVRDLLTSQRLEEVTVQEIVDLAGISRPTFYAHFDTKYSVVAALIDDMGQTIYALWQPFFDAEGPIEHEVLRELGIGTLRAWRQQATLFSATIEGWHSDHEIHDTWNDVLDRFGRALTVRLRRCRALREDDDMVVTALVNLFERCVYLAVATPDSPLARSDEQLADVLAMMWMQCLRPSEDPGPRQARRR